MPPPLQAGAAQSRFKPILLLPVILAGRFYRTALNGLLQRINSYLVRWAKRKYKRLRTFKKVRKWWEGLTARQPRLFAHWAWVTDSRYSL